MPRRSGGGGSRGSSFGSRGGSGFFGGGAPRASSGSPYRTRPAAARSTMTAPAPAR